MFFKFLVCRPQTSSRNFFAGRPKAALLFWFFSDFRCGVPLFMIVLVINKYKKGKKNVKC